MRVLLWNEFNLQNSPVFYQGPHKLDEKQKKKLINQQRIFKEKEKNSEKSLTVNRILQRNTKNLYMHQPEYLF